MPNLKASLSALDPGFVRIVAGFWGIENEIDNDTLLVNNLIVLMLNGSQLNEIVDSLPSSAKEAMKVLIKNESRIPWSEFTRRFGKINEIGQGKIEREKPYLKRNTATDMLWYRGLLFRAFLEENGEAREFAYLPDEFFGLLRSNSISPSPIITGKPFGGISTLTLQPASDHILDDACTMLAAIRAGLIVEKSCQLEIPSGQLETLLRSAGILNEILQPRAEIVKRFLESERSLVLQQLYNSWEKSETLNELWLMPEIKCEGKWKNHPRAARASLVKLLKKIPPGKWWDLEAFVADVRQIQPDFLRPSGDYDSWIIRNRASGEYIRGFAHWEHVEGRYLKCLITQWLHWLGLVDLAISNENQLALAFRLSAWSNFLFNYQKIPNLPKENEKVLLRSNGSLFCPRLSPRSVRYQIARFCEWGEAKKDGYYYYLSASALQKAEKQQINITQLINLLKSHAKAPIPLSFLQAMNRWEKNNLQARFETGILLKVTDASILDELEKGQSRRFIIERLSPKALLIKQGGEKVIQRALMEIGYLSENTIHL